MPSFQDTYLIKLLLADIQINRLWRSAVRVLACGIYDAKTVWLYPEGLAQAGVVDTLFKEFDAYLGRPRVIDSGWQFRDFATVPAPCKHNKRDENKAIKKAKMPEGWADKPVMRSQKDTNAPRTEKREKSH